MNDINVIEITHNPFTVDTSFLFNGQEPSESCKLWSYKESRLQTWVESLFDELDELFNGDNHYRIIFTGVESDYLDILEAAEAAITNGMYVETEWIETTATEERLEKMKALVKEARENPDFDHFIENNDDFRASVEEAFNRDFDMYVVATMSSGKSTLINAMLGSDLLPVANEATTATIARITDYGDMPDGVFSAKRYDDNGDLVGSEDNVTADVLKEWNKSCDTKLIDIRGNIQAIEEREEVRLVLTDTPGPNNSQDEEHQRTTMGFIQDSRRNPLILYVLNGTQLGTDDDRNLLRLIAKIMDKGGKQSKDRFIFVVNKMDEFDPESGESIESALVNVRNYLEKNGISNPQIYPISANFTRLIRKPSDSHTRRERGEYKLLADLFDEEPSMNMLQYMPLTARVQRNLQDKNHSPLMMTSGLPAVEAMIDEYIDKYNLPHRLKRTYDALSKAIEVGLNEAELIERITSSEQGVKEIEEEINLLKEKQEKGFDVQEYKDRVEREGIQIPKKTEDLLREQLDGFYPILRDISKSFNRSDVTITVAENRLAEAESRLSFEYQKTINNIEEVFSKNQEYITKNLYDEYQKYVLDLFADAKELNLPILEGMQKAVSNISFNLNLNSNDVQSKEVVVGTRTVKDSTWYKPWSWGKTREVNVYGTEEYVDLQSLWDDRLVSIERPFGELVESSYEMIRDNQSKLIDQFLLFMDQEFSSRFADLIKSLEGKVKDKESRIKANEEAKRQHQWIDDFKSKIDSILEV